MCLLVFPSLAQVNTPPYVRFYCGAPLISSEGQVLGSLAVLDIKPRTMPAGALRRAALRSAWVVRAAVPRCCAG